MIDRFQQLARLMYPLRYLALAGCGMALAGLTVILLSAPGHASERYLPLCAAGLFWCLSGYAFIINFHTVPQRPAPDSGLWARVKHRLQRAWYGLLALVFIATSVAALWISLRMLLLWARN